MLCAVLKETYNFSCFFFYVLRQPNTHTEIISHLISFASMSCGAYTSIAMIFGWRHHHRLRSRWHCVYVHVSRGVYREYTEPVWATGIINIQTLFECAGNRRKIDTHVNKNRLPKMPWMKKMNIREKGVSFAMSALTIYQCKVKKRWLCMCCRILCEWRRRRRRRRNMLWLPSSDIHTANFLGAQNKT